MAAEQRGVLEQPSTPPGYATVYRNKVEYAFVIHRLGLDTDTSTDTRT